jgi:hypothetical protein
MSQDVLYQSATIEHCDRVARILCLAPFFGESTKGKEYKLKQLAYLITNTILCIYYNFSPFISSRYIYSTLLNMHYYYQQTSLTRPQCSN